MAYWNEWHKHILKKFYPIEPKTLYKNSAAKTSVSNKDDKTITR